MKNLKNYISWAWKTVSIDGVCVCKHTRDQLKLGCHTMMMPVCKALSITIVVIPFSPTWVCYMSRKFWKDSIKSSSDKKTFRTKTSSVYLVKKLWKLRTVVIFPLIKSFPEGIPKILPSSEKMSWLWHFSEVAAAVVISFS